jgi:hypothetical protein
MHRTLSGPHDDGVKHLFRVDAGVRYDQQQGESMAFTMIEQYEVMYSANKFPPRIWLKSEGKGIGQLVFMPNGTTLPPDSSGSLFYHLDDFGNILSLLQNEKPMYWLFNGTGNGTENAIKTTPEPIGEEEGVGG